MADPALTSHEDGGTFTTCAEVFTWSAGTLIDNYWLHVGSTSGGIEWYDSGNVPASRLSVGPVLLPGEGETIYVTLGWNAGGTLGSTLYTMTAVTEPNYQYTSLYYRSDNPRWYQCERCGFLYPEDEVTTDPRAGRLVCYEHCLDDPNFGIYDDIILTGRVEPIYRERD